VLALVWAPGTALAAEPAPAQAHAPLPPSLVALEQKMEELKVTSLRFAAQVEIAVPPHESELLHLLKALGGESRGSGEETISPAAANVTVSVFGSPFTLRMVGNVTYVYIHALARRDHGRPWVRLGSGGLIEVFTVNGKPVKPPKTSESKVGEPALVEPPFASIRKALAGAEEVREIAPGTLGGQPVTNFLAVLEPGQLEHEQLASTARLVAHPQPPTGTLEVSFGQEGLPVRTVITEHDEGTTVTATLSIPAINFPLVIEAPPASQTIGVAQLRTLERRDRRHRHPKRKK
jgi:hypothetical protein